MQGARAWRTIPAMTTNRRVLLRSRPVGEPKPTDFEIADAPMPTPADGEILVRTIWLSLDPYMRGRMNDVKSYSAPVELGGVMTAGTVGEVVESRHPGFRSGDFVLSYGGWQTHHIARAGAQPGPFGPLKLDPTQAPISTALGVLGMPGMTAYVGLYDIGQPKAGETVVVSGAAGAVGQTVGQLARIKGCRVVGIAGGADKGAWLTDELGFDAAVDYKSTDFKRELRAALPGGIDVFFDNVGGDVFEACLFAMNNFGRIACCGAVSQYDGEPPRHGPRGIPGLIVTKRLTLRGFVVMDFADQNDKALADLQAWVASGQIKVQEDIIEGLENLPNALIGLLAGENRGKRMVRV